MPWECTYDPVLYKNNPTIHPRTPFFLSPIHFLATPSIIIATFRHLIPNPQNEAHPPRFPHRSVPFPPPPFPIQLTSPSLGPPRPLFEPTICAQGSTTGLGSCGVEGGCAHLLEEWACGVLYKYPSNHAESSQQGKPARLLARLSYRISSLVLAISSYL